MDGQKRYAPSHLLELAAELTSGQFILDFTDFYSQINLSVGGEWASVVEYDCARPHNSVNILVESYLMQRLR